MLIHLIYALILGVSGAPTVPVDEATSTDVSQLEKRWPQGGIKVLTDSCTDAELSTVNDAITDAVNLARAGLNAAADFNAFPFPYFFKRDIAVANDVAAVLQRVIDSQQGKGDLFEVRCNNFTDVCMQDRLYGFTTVVSLPFDARPSEINICPIALRLPRNTPPCGGKLPGVKTLGWMMLDSMAHVPGIRGTERETISAGTSTARAVRHALEAGEDTRELAGAYSFMSNFAWDLGYGAVDGRDVTPCPWWFWRGHFG